MKKLLIISYFYPPCANSGVQRAVKMAIHLPDYGWMPFVLTVENGYCYRFDDRLPETVKDVPVFRAKQIYPFRHRNSYWAKKWQSIWKRILILDEHVGWIPFAIRLGQKVIKKHGIDALFVTGSPFSSFLIGLALKRKTGLPLYLDYRDTWIPNPGFVSGRNRWLALWIEKIGLKNCDLYFGASPAITEEIGQRYSLDTLNNKGRTFTHSYDVNDFPTLNRSKSAIKDKLSLLAVGRVYDNSLWDNLVVAIRKLKDAGLISSQNFHFASYGNLRPTISFDDEIKKMIEFNFYISRHEILKKMLQCDGLILPVGGEKFLGLHYPVRLVEYFAVKKPILYLGQPGVTADAIRNSGIGLCADTQDANNIKSALCEFITKIRNDSFQPNNKYIASFDTKNVIKKFVHQIEELYS